MDQLITDRLRDNLTRLNLTRASEVLEAIGSSFPESCRHTTCRRPPSDEIGIWENNIGFL